MLEKEWVSGETITRSGEKSTCRGKTLPGRGGARLSGWVVSLSWGVVAGATAWVGELIDGSMEDCGVNVVVDSGGGSGGA